ncbi:hypothetical protein C8046_09450 [Serinibacter arcticus]|uniref:CshA domain-containing protein n=1 Tax=Serinibacter arcticus TaxID=1655435 RepID=A0A2U1ZV51_9MICO|nr:hypothetical protein C8046_09450 [Serinibacter arcticus]
MPGPGRDADLQRQRQPGDGDDPHGHGRCLDHLHLPQRPARAVDRSDQDGLADVVLAPRHGADLHVRDPQHRQHGAQQPDRRGHDARPVRHHLLAGARRHAAAERHGHVLRDLHGHGHRRARGVAQGQQRHGGRHAADRPGRHRHRRRHGHRNLRRHAAHRRERQRCRGVQPERHRRRKHQRRPRQRDDHPRTHGLHRSRRHQRRQDADHRPGHLEHPAQRHGRLHPGPGLRRHHAPAQYRITDSNGQTATANVTATLRPGPVAAPDTATTNQDVTVALPVLDNDTAGQTAAGGVGTKDVTSVIFPTTGQPAGATITDDGRTLTVPGQGVYTANPTTGVVSFDPEPTFTGETSPVTYSFADGSGNRAQSTITVTVAPVNPVAIDDATITVFGTAVTLAGSTNDVPGPGGAIQPGLTVFTSDEATNGGKSLVTPEGTWEIQPGGEVRFDPAPGYVGTTPTVEYQITDANGQTDTATLQVTVRPGPSAVPDTATTPQNVTVSFPILDDDTAGLRVDGSEGALDPASVAFQTTGLPAGSETSNDGRTLTVPGEGVYTWDPATELVSFDPEPAFTGVASPVFYTVLDQEGNVASTTITVTVTAITPTATDNSAKTPAATPVTLDPAADDVAGADSAPIDPTTVRFTSPAATGGGTSLVVDGEGTWTVDAAGIVTFTPEADFAGTTTPVEYSVADTNGTTATADLTVVVGTAPVATPDSATTPQNTNVTLPVLTNDVAGDQGNACEPGETDVPVGCDTGTLDAGSVVFPTDGQPDGAVVSDDGKTLTVPGEGVYTIDPTTGDVTFDPEAAFTGATSPVTYAVTDSYENVATATVVVTVLAIVPTAVDDQLPTAFNTPVALPGSTNDVPGTVGGVTPAIDDAATIFPTDGQPAGAVVSADGKTITVDGEGAYVIAADGTVTFTPVDGYSGTTTPVTYRITDVNGTTDDGALSVVVRPGPVAATVPGETLQGVDLTVDPKAGATPGTNADGTPGTFDDELTVFPTEGQPDGAVVSDDGKTLTVPGEGVYTINPDGSVTFSPEPTFSGPATPVAVQLTDNNGNPATSTVAIVVTAVVPVAASDAASTPFATPVTFPFAANDTPGSDLIPIDAASGTFEAADLPEDSDWTIADGGKTLTVPGEGVWTLNDDGTVTFAPEATFSGDTTPVTYTVRDTNGTPTTAELTVTVQAGPAAEADVNSTPQNVTVVTDVLGNDTPGLNADGSSGTWLLDSVVFPIEGQPEGATISDDGRTLTVPGEGVYTVVLDGDQAGQITFDPEPAFRGVATPVTYSVTDSLGNAATALLTITVEGIDPTATPDAATTPFNTPVTLAGPRTTPRARTPHPWSRSPRCSRSRVSPPTPSSPTRAGRSPSRVRASTSSPTTARSPSRRSPASRARRRR